MFDIDDARETIFEKIFKGSISILQKAAWGTIRDIISHSHDRDGNKHDNWPKRASWFNCGFCFSYSDSRYRIRNNKYTIVTTLDAVTTKHTAFKYHSLSHMWSTNWMVSYDLWKCSRETKRTCKQDLIAVLTYDPECAAWLTGDVCWQNQNSNRDFS